ncbi:MAG: hypothetical protein KatS3mg089_0303 [Patescibacteria group bacterium]|nr:MAG: hypothetical protein KatS3mg089_0303 [Patescibacteria group bacterium]
MPLFIQVIALAIFFVWLLILTYLLVQMSQHYNMLTKDISKKTLTAFLEQIIKELEINKKNIARISEQCDKIEKDGQLHIQKIGLLRFNPFKDTGGDQSFILALVDAQDTGVIISGLYSRSGTRWYAKKVVNGKGVEYELSDEEKKALSIAQKVESRPQKIKV